MEYRMNDTLLLFWYNALGNRCSVSLSLAQKARMILMGMRDMLFFKSNYQIIKSETPGPSGTVPGISSSKRLISYD